MSAAHDDLMNKVLELPVDARVKLVEKLISSLNVPTQKEIDELWAKEAQRRVEQIENGEVELIPGDEVFEKIRNNISR